MADCVDAAWDNQLVYGTPEYWEAEICSLLGRVDNIERNIVERSPTSARCRQIGKKLLRRVRNNPEVIKNNPEIARILGIQE